MFRFSGGNEVFNRTRSELLSQSFHNNGTEVLGRWQSPEKPGDGVTPRLYIGRSNFTNLNENTVSRFVEDASFVKLDNIRLGYSLPKAISQRVNIESIRIFAQAQNVVTFSSYKGLDPEMAGGSGFSGVDYNSSPIQRVLSMGINVNF
jgi:hypothetical protein